MKIKRILTTILFSFFISSCFSSGAEKGSALSQQQKDAKTQGTQPKSGSKTSTSSSQDQAEKTKIAELKKQIENLEEEKKTLKAKIAVLEAEKEKETKRLKKVESQLNVSINELDRKNSRMKTFSLFVVILLILLFVIFLFLIIVLLKLSRREKRVLELLKTNKKLQEYIENIESKHSSIMNKTTSDVTGSSLGKFSFGASRFSGKVESTFTPRLEASQEIEKPAPPDLISPLYNDKQGRDERRIKGESDVFLDIAQVMYLQMQRNERITSVLLEKQGTWRNSMFVLIGQSLYINFYSYNENRSFSLDSAQTEELTRLIYDVEGEGNLIKCEPATINMAKNGYSVVHKGKLILR